MNPFSNPTGDADPTTLSVVYARLIEQFLFEATLQDLWNSSRVLTFAIDEPAGPGIELVRNAVAEVRTIVAKLAESRDETAQEIARLLETRPLAAVIWHTELNRRLAEARGQGTADFWIRIQSAVSRLMGQIVETAVRFRLDLKR